MLKAGQSGRNGRARRAVLGVGLIEVLVSILLASVGLLALAAMQAYSLRYAKLSQHRAVATLLATDVAERMRANPGATVYMVRDTFDQQSTLPPTPAPGCDEAAHRCSADQLAAADLHQWRQLVREQLPAGSVFLAADSAVDRAYDLWLAWREVAMADADELVRTGGAKECHNDLSLAGEPTVRCLYFRVQL